MKKGLQCDQIEFGLRKINCSEQNRVCVQSECLKCLQKPFPGKPFNSGVNPNKLHFWIFAVKLSNFVT